MKLTKKQIQEAEIQVYRVFTEEKIIKLIMNMLMEKLTEDQITYLENRAKRLGVELKRG